MKIYFLLIILAIAILLTKVQECNSLESVPDHLKKLDKNASALYSQEKYSEAEKAYINLLKEAEKALGANHDFFETIYYRLADTYFSEQKIKEAAETYEKLLNYIERSKIKSILIDIYYNRLGRCYEALGKYNSAIINFEKELSLENNEKKPDIILINGIKEKIAYNYYLLGEYAEAEKLLKDILDYSDDKHGYLDWSTIRKLNSLAAVYCCQQKYREAEEIYLIRLNKGVKDLGKINPKLTDLLWSLSKFYEAINKKDESIKYANWVKEIDLTTGEKVEIKRCSLNKFEFPPLKKNVESKDTL